MIGIDDGKADQGEPEPRLGLAGAIDIAAVEQRLEHAAMPRRDRQCDRQLVDGHGLVDADHRSAPAVVAGGRQAAGRGFGFDRAGLAGGDRIGWRGRRSAGRSGR